MKARKHTWNDSVTANARGVDAPQEALHVSFVRRNQTTFHTSNTRTFMYGLSENTINLHPLSPLPKIPKNSSQTAVKRTFNLCL